MRCMEDKALTYPVGGMMLQNHDGFGDTGFMVGWGQLTIL